MKSFIAVLLIVMMLYSLKAAAQSTEAEAIDIEGVQASTRAPHQIFNKQFGKWSPNSLHWEAPSNLLINSDGSWFLYSHHVANNRRDCAIPGIDCGHPRTALVNVTYYDGPVQDGKCSGVILHTKDYVLAGLGYKDEIWDASMRDTDVQVAAAVARIRCGSFTRRWR